jgi:hypothetical protein
VERPIAMYLRRRPGEFAGPDALVVLLDADDELGA